jgi:hypothetical protein
LDNRFPLQDSSNLVWMTQTPFLMLGWVAGVHSLESLSALSTEAETEGWTKQQNCSVAQSIDLEKLLSLQTVARLDGSAQMPSWISGLVLGVHFWVSGFTRDNLSVEGRSKQQNWLSLQVADLARDLPWQAAVTFAMSAQKPF